MKRPRTTVERLKDDTVIAQGDTDIRNGCYARLEMFRFCHP
jgi:hypothetical protein